MKLLETVVWSPVSLGRRGIAALVGAFIGGLVGELLLLILEIGNWSYMSQQTMLEAGFIEGFVGAGAGLFLSGVVRGRLDEHNHFRPNQGIRSSARNGLFGLFVGLAILGGGFVIP